MQIPRLTVPGTAKITFFHFLPTPSVLSMYLLRKDTRTPFEHKLCSTFGLDNHQCLNGCRPFLVLLVGIFVFCGLNGRIWPA